MTKNQQQPFWKLVPRTIILIGLGLVGVVFGVVFGLIFEDWVRVGPQHSTSSERPSPPLVELPPSQSQPPSAEPEVKPATPLPPAAPLQPSKYKVRVGPYASREAALAAGEQLKSLGYSVMVGTTAPFLIQVGAFTNPTYAAELKQKLLGQGYQVLIEQQ